MNVIGFCLVLVSVLSHVAGQILLKQSMAPDRIKSRNVKTLLFIGAITGFTLSFFVGLGLLQKYDLSYFYPFQGLSVVFVTLAAFLFLKERITLQLTIGMVLISLGIILVSES